MSTDFANKTALVTGAARGIGLAIARRLAVAGARVTIADVNADAGESAAQSLRAAGLYIEFQYTDLTAPGGATAMINAAATRMGGMDILINNARAGQRLGLLDETEQNWDAAVNVGLKAAFFASQAAIPLMATRGKGAIVNIASVAATLVTNESPSYHAAKAGLVQLTRYLAVTAGKYHVRVNSVLPGLIVQDEHRQRYDSTGNEPYRATASFYQPLGKPGSEADVAEAVHYLCSDNASYVSGSCLVIDGGATVQEQFGMLLRQPMPQE